MHHCLLAALSSVQCGTTNTEKTSCGTFAYAYWLHTQEPILLSGHLQWCLMLHLLMSWHQLQSCTCQTPYLIIGLSDKEDSSLLSVGRVLALPAEVAG